MIVKIKSLLEFSSYHSKEEFIAESHNFELSFLSFQQFTSRLRATPSFDVPDQPIHYDIINKSHVDISNFGQYFVTAIETLLINQRKLHIKPYDKERTVAINCGYIGTNDYVIDPADREFMIRVSFDSYL